jgi:hypothetical protein
VLIENRAAWLHLSAGTVFLVGSNVDARVELTLGVSGGWRPQGVRLMEGLRSMHATSMNKGLPCYRGVNPVEAFTATPGHSGTETTEAR